MASFTFDMDKKTVNYEMQNGDKFDFFRVTLVEDSKSMYGLICPKEAELLVVALTQFIDSKKKKHV